MYHVNTVKKYISIKNSKMKKKSPKGKGKVPLYKNKSTMPSTVQERSSRYFELRDENTELKGKLKEYDTDLKEMASKLIKLQKLMDESMKQTGSSKPQPMEMEKLITLTKENKKLKALAKVKEEELRGIHTVKAHCRQYSTCYKTKTKQKIRGDVNLTL